MLKFMRWTVGNLLLLALFPAGVAAQNYVYTNNDQATTNSISAFSVDTNGALSEIGGSPFLTGGAGRGSGLYSPNRIVVINDFLYASNAASNSVSAFTINTGTGVLTAVAGSPFPTNAIDDIGHSGISLAATPDGEFLYAGSTGFDGQSFGSITIFSIDTSTGALTMVGAAPVSSGGPVYSMKVTPDGKFLAVALAQTSQIAVFAVQSDGTLQAVTNSPFTLSSDPATGVDINCGSNLLFAGGATENIYAFSISSDGQLTPVAGSPFATGLSSTQVIALSTDDSTLYTSNAADNTLVAFPAGSDGSLTLPGTVADAGTDAISPTGLSVSQDGTFLYAADTAISGLGVGGISTFTLGGTMLINFASLTSTGISSQLHSVAAYPAKACSAPPPPPSTGLAANLQISSSPPPGFDLNATLSLDTSLVADPLAQPVTIQLGDFSLTIPAGSFKYFRNGVNEGTYLFQGVIGRTTLKVQIVPLSGNEFQISAYGKHVDVSRFSSPVIVTVGIGDNSASTSVTPTAAELRGNWRDF
jgi:6-phosphogluconolactonase